MEPFIKPSPCPYRAQDTFSGILLLGSFTGSELVRHPGLKPLEVRRSPVEDAGFQAARV